MRRARGVVFWCHFSLSLSLLAISNNRTDLARISGRRWEVVTWWCWVVVKVVDTVH